MKAAWVATLFLLTLLPACAPRPPQGYLELERQGPPAPAGTPAITEAVDGLVVGHRLMAAGEYELALKAYTRGALEHGLTADVLSAMGSANLRLGRLNQAEDLLRRAVKKDADFVAAWNNLGVVLMERGETAEARQVFRRAFALDNGNSEEIRDNLRLAIAKMEKPTYDEPEKYNFELVRRGNGRYLLLPTPGQRSE
ncbi:hypothetical protein DDZ14_12230 [Maritimibacter sp. 55A14]|uniref:tetratricopeptide repeat protein n=1 Tax=Maritimibacter sp. 55A14 TaxID=2174844 RepID=UPI000D61F5CD|nr:tetratricopeptide repeat protein [Maritimibacter sp. 55A14]PWE31980.1 hypothetical protein DDZ14_12230 [Maritimibacter sp. 55A14]